MSDRHGLIAGATGAGKTLTLQAMAEAFSRAGVAKSAVRSIGSTVGCQLICGVMGSLLGGSSRRR